MKSIYMKLAFILCLSVGIQVITNAQGSCTAWDVIDGDLTQDNNFWDPDQDGQICINCATPNNGNEINDLNPLNNSISGWVKLNGSDPSGDPVTSGTCGNSDIVDDNDGGDFAYYNVVDPDAIPDNGNERLAFAVRMANQINGNFGLSFLLNADGPCDTDPNTICGNPCFEYEIQLNTNNQRVFAYDVDGCFGCNDATLCGGAECNTGALQVCMKNSSCGVGDNSVLWFFYIDIADLNGSVSVTSSNGLSVVPVTATSSNGVINKASNISDYGGIDNTPGVCPACTPPPGCTGADATDYCLLICAADNNEPVPLPIELVYFEGKETLGDVYLEWGVQSQVNNDRFEVQRSLDGRNFETIGSIKGALLSNSYTVYNFIDKNPAKGYNYYRLKQIDINSLFDYSETVAIRIEKENNVNVLPTVFNQSITINFSDVSYNNANITIFDASGKAVHQEYISNLNGFATKQLNCENLPGGIYFLTIESEGGISHHKLFKK